MASQMPGMSDKPEHFAEEVETPKLDGGSSRFDDLDLNNTLASKPDDSDGHTEWSYKKLLACLSLAGFYVAGATPTLLIGGSLKYIAEDLNAEFASWLITANTLVVASSSLFVGYLTDLFGSRYIMLTGSLLLMVGIAITGSAHTFGQAVAGMAINGLGCGICEVNALSGISALAPVRLRGRFIASITCMIVFFTPYPFYTQQLCRNVTWRWVCWILLIWTGVWWIVCALTYFPDTRKHRIEGLSKSQILKRMDWIGGLTSAAGLTLVLVALQDGGYRYPWKSAHVIAPLVIGFVVFGFFVVWEGWLAPHPMIPRVLFKLKGVVIPLSLAFTAGVTYYSVLAFSPLLIQELYYNKSPNEIGLLEFGVSLGLLVGSVLGSAAISYTRGHVRWPMLVSAMLMTSLTGALMHSNPNDPNFTAAVGAFCAVGIGGVLVGSASIALSCCPDSLIATVSGLSMSVRTFGGAVGTTIYTSIFQNKVAAILPGEVAKYAVQAGLPPSSAPAFVEAFLTPGANVTAVPHVTPQILAQAALGSAWGAARAFKYVWATSVAFGAVSCIVCFFVPNTRKYMTNRIAVDITGPRGTVTGGHTNGKVESA